MSLQYLVFAVLSLYCCCVSSQDSSNVVELSAANFAEKVKEGPWLIEFFAPWCGHCKRLTPIWESLATQLKDKANVAKVDCTQFRDLCTENGVRGFPTIKYFENGEEKDKYAGARTVTAFASFLKTKGALSEDVEVTETANPDQLPPQQPKEKQPEAQPQAVDSGDVVVLDQNNYQDTIKEGFWFIKFYAPWCGHCKRLAPTWDQLATALKGKANIAKVDCTISGDVCSKIGIRGYPTLKLFKDGAEQANYESGRDLSSFVTYLKQQGALPQDVPVAIPQEQQQQQQQQQQPPAAKQEEEPSNVVTLGGDFEEKTKEGAWFVKFYAPWCGHCKRLVPTWDELATKINVDGREVTIAKVDCTQHGAVCQSQDVKGYPTLKLIRPSGVEGYRGGRDLESLSKFLVDQGLSLTPKAAHDEL